MHKAWKYIVNNRDVDTPNKADVDRGPRLLPRKIEMSVLLKDRSSIEQYKSRVQDSISVHARLGNGEQDIKFKRSDGVWVTEDRRTYHAKRMSTDKNRFIAEMKKHGDCSFFICTDTQSFFDECKDIFGDRVFSIDREWLPPGWGPGHNISSRPYAQDIKTQWRERQIDPWDLLYTDLMDMELMCYSKHLICNLSQFNFFARVQQKCTIIS